MVYLHNGILHSRKKKGIPTFHNSMAGTGEYYAKLNKSGDEKQIPYDLTHKWSLNNKTNLLEIFRNDKCSNEVKNSE